MLTDCPPRKARHLAGFLESDRLRTLDLPQDERLRTSAISVDSAMKAGTTAAVRHACAEFLAAASDFYRVPRPGVRVLATRPLPVHEADWATELFGGYTPATMLIRVWMRTAVRKQVTSFRTFLSTLCHEFCHHLDYQQLRFCDLPSRAGNAAEAIILGGGAGRSLADRLAAHESRCLSLQVTVNFLDGGSSQRRVSSARWHREGSHGGRGTNVP